jgi:hypothetical protein
VIGEDADIAELKEQAAKKRRLLWALFGNVVLLVVMLGGPFARGILRAHQAWRDFGRFGACLYGGKTLENPGLGVPTGSEAHFAAELLARSPQWPERCQALLHQILADEPIFLLPTVKSAEIDVRTAAKVVERELEAVLVRVPGERLSLRPLRAVEQLRAVLSRHALTAGVIEVPQDDAFALDNKRHGVPIPTRVPIYAASDARLALWGGDSELHALALDSTGVSYAHVAGGSMNQARLPRPKLLESFVPTPEGGWFVWAMPQRRCRERAEGCATKALGVAALSLPLSQMPLPRWLGAHPFGRIDRSLWFRETQLSVWAEASDKQLQLRAFSLPSEPADQAATELPPLAAIHSLASVAASDAQLVALAGEPLPLFASRSAEATTLWQLEPGGPRSLAQLPASSSAWLSANTCADHVALAFGTERELLVATIKPDRSVQVWPTLALGLSDVVHERDPNHDRVQVICTDDKRVVLFARDPHDVLLAVTCAPGAACERRALANDVQHFAAQRMEEQLWLAYAGSKNVAQIRLLGLDLKAKTRVAERVVAACWAPQGGLCGAPVLARVGQRLLLGAREGTDLMLIESPDGGQHWEPLRGLKRLH